MIVLITGNEGKKTEFERLLNTQLEIQELDLPELQATDVREVAKLKAEEAFKRLGKPCLVDDTGLTIEEWGELPGALIRWFLDNVGTVGIIKMLSSANSRAARVTTALGYCDENGSQVFAGEVNGAIADQPRGSNGFGYDEIFMPEGQNKTFAEMTAAEKDAVSMRALAAQAFREAGLA